ncbi:uncharacterized protein BJX67DRAFT_260945 [Aspergillus lucknowensis]|uniref:F-box domain-containing protein n=1 Tax=Aspergillus lucknowensis TaxID=176173 RepID=A0ABR4LG73_9EURO
MLHLCSLPPPLLLDVFRYAVEDSDFLPLLLICRQLRGVAEDVIYRDITQNLLYTPDPCRRLHLLFRTLFHRRDLASRVRSLTIRCARDILSPRRESHTAERSFITELDLPSPDGWVGGCANNFTEAYVTLIMLITPNLLHMHIESGDMSDAFPDMFHPVVLDSFPGERRFRNLRTLTYGPGPARQVADTTLARAIVPFFYLPQLRELRLTGLFGRFDGWLDRERPTTGIQGLSLVGAGLDFAYIDEILAACPDLKYLTIGVKQQHDSIATAYGHIGRGLLNVQSSIEEINISFGESEGPAPFHPPGSNIRPLCSLAEFPALWDVAIPIVAYLGGRPREASALESFVPRRLERLRFYDDIWAVEPEDAELYWSTLFGHLAGLLRRKAEVAPGFYEVSFFIHPSEQYYDFGEGIDGIQELADRADVAVRYFGVADDE